MCEMLSIADQRLQTGPESDRLLGYSSIMIQHFNSRFPDFDPILTNLPKQELRIPTMTQLHSKSSTAIGSGLATLASPRAYGNISLRGCGSLFRLAAMIAHRPHVLWW